MEGLGENIDMYGRMMRRDAPGCAWRPFISIRGVACDGEHFRVVDRQASCKDTMRRGRMSRLHSASPSVPQRLHLGCTARLLLYRSGCACEGSCQDTIRCDGTDKAYRNLHMGPT